MPCVPFCVVEKPFVVWGHDVAGDNRDFLERVDADLYYRTAHNIIAGGGEVEGSGALPEEFRDGLHAPHMEVEDDQDRKDVSTLSRLLWHHGMETFVMMLGALIQAPGAAHGYFLKCRTEDAAALAELLLREERPRYSRLTDVPFTLVNLLASIHRCAAWEDRDEFVGRCARAFRGMLRQYTTEQHRWEYNSIKHGLRAFHGRFGLAFGIQEAPGTPAPPEAMEMVGFSRDASFFDVAKPLGNATRQASKMHFLTHKVSVSWSLEKVICELQLLSVLLRNTVSALRIAGGEAPGTVTFNRIVDADPFWETYFSLHAGNVPNASFGDDLDAREVRLLSEKDVFASYRTRGS